MGKRKETGDYAKKWAFLPIEHLVVASDLFVVFIDKELDVDYETSPQFTPDTHKDISKHRTIVAKAMRVERTPCEGLSPANKLSFKRLIGEAMASSFLHDYENAEVTLKEAVDFVNARRQELSRRWYLTAAVRAGMWFLAGGGVCWLLKTSMIGWIGGPAFTTTMCGFAGALGAVLSVLNRTGKLQVDCAAGEQLHVLEGTCRVLAGSLSGILIGVAVLTEVILAPLTRSGNLSGIALLAAFVAGTSERLAASIISTLEAANIAKPAPSQHLVGAKEIVSHG